MRHITENKTSLILGDAIIQLTSKLSTESIEKFIDYSCKSTNDVWRSDFRLHYFLLICRQVECSFVNEIHHYGACNNMGRPLILPLPSLPLSHLPPTPT